MQYIDHASRCEGLDRSIFVPLVPLYRAAGLMLRVRWLRGKSWGSAVNAQHSYADGAFVDRSLYM